MTLGLRTVPTIGDASMHAGPTVSTTRKWPTRGEKLLPNITLNRTTERKMSAFASRRLCVAKP